MLVYYFLIAVILALSLTSWILQSSSGGNDYTKKLFALMITASLSTVLALRSTSVGVDLTNYLNHFRRLPLGLAAERFEPGYEVLNRLVYAISPSEQLMLAVTAVLAIAPIGYVIYRHSFNIYLSWLLYAGFGFYSFAFSGLRQSIALAACFIAYHFMTKEWWVRALLAIAIAVSFHASAVIFLPALLIYRMKFSSSNVAIGMVATTLVWISREQLYVYFGDVFMGQAIISQSDSYTWMTISAAFFTLALVSYRTLKDQASEALGLYPIVLTGVLLMMFVSIGENALRAANYYYQFVILLVPNSLAVVQDRGIRALLVAGIGAGAGVLFFLTVAGQAYNIVPYSFFWE